MTFVKHLDDVWNSKGLMLAFYTSCYFAYIALGGLIFLIIEGAQEGIVQNSVKNAREDFMKKYPFVSEESVDELLAEVQVPSARNRGLHINQTNIPRWTYSQSVFFSVTLLTTVGYGHVAPISKVGKAVCMIYTGLGIPFTLLVLAAYVQRLMAASKCLLKGLEFCFRSKLRPVSIRIIHQVLITVIIIVCFFITPATLFLHLEKDWTYLDALYFCFISLTTVGLGDFVPGEDPNQEYQALYHFGVSGYILVGVTTLMYFMAQIAEFQQYMMKQMRDPEAAPIVAHVENYGTITIEEKAPQNQWQNLSHTNCVSLE